MIKNVSNIRKVVVGIAVAAFSLSACTAGGASHPSSGSDKGDKKVATVKAVASTTQICDYISQLASGSKGTGLVFRRTGPDGKTETVGDKAGTPAAELDLTCLLAPNASAHEHDMSAQQAKALAEADLFFVSGVDLEHFLDGAVASTGFKGTMVVTSGVLTAGDIDNLDAQVQKEKALSYRVERGKEKVAVEKWPFPPESGEKEPEFRYDPHVWTAPRNAIVQVKNIGAALESASGLDEKTAAIFKDHVSTYVKQLEDLDQWAKKSFDSVPPADRVLFTSHDAFGYLSKEFGIKFEGAALSDFNSQQDATAQKIQETVDKVKASHAKAIFAENSNNPQSVQKVAQLAGVRAVIGDEALYGDSLGEPGSDGATYIGSILHNVTQLVKAWGGAPAAIPAQLQAWAPRAEQVK